MKNRNERLMEIRRLIGSMNISSQEELLKLLEKQGYEMTQATLSRDLKYLKVAKMPDDNAGYVYILPDKEQVVEETESEVKLEGELVHRLGITGKVREALRFTGPDAFRAIWEDDSDGGWHVVLDRHCERK